MAEDLLGDPTFYLMLIAIVILAFVTYYEIKFMRRKRMQREESRIEVDDIYNQIVTTRAVSRAVKAQGRSTKEADLAILEADTAYSRGGYTEAKAAVERAKGLLRDAKREEDVAPRVGEGPKDAAPAARSEECEVPFQEARKLPQNFMESKFMICSMRDEADAAERAGRDVSAARGELGRADEAFAAERYTEALSHALKAKRSLEPREEAPPKQAKLKDLSSVEKVPPAVVVKAPSSKCEKCSTELEPGDMFCPKCGAKVERDIRCPRCANKVKVDDAYCRKCGLPLRHD